MIEEYRKNEEDNPEMKRKYDEAIARAPLDPWFDDRAPPLAMWVAGRDELVDGPRLLRRFENGREPHANVVHARVIEDYEHLDVIWAVDAIEQVGKELIDVIWKTVPADVKQQCVIPRDVSGAEKNGENAVA